MTLFVLKICMVELKRVLDIKVFKTIVDSTPLISTDLLIANNNKILLGKRKNNPAKGYYFSIGGRIYKNETIEQAIERISMEELRIKMNGKSEFIGVFEHFYENSYFDDISTYYVNLAYKCRVENIKDMPNEQHSEYQWFGVEELLNSKQVHPYVKDYFK